MDGWTMEGWTDKRMDGWMTDEQKDMYVYIACINANVLRHSLNLSVACLYFFLALRKGLPCTLSFSGSIWVGASVLSWDPGFRSAWSTLLLRTFWVLNTVLLLGWILSLWTPKLLNFREYLPGLGTCSNLEPQTQGQCPGGK